MLTTSVVAGLTGSTLAAAEYVVAFKPSIGIQSVEKNTGDNLKWGRSIEFSRKGIGIQQGGITYRAIEISDDQTDVVLAELAARPDVQSVQPNFPVILHSVSELNDPLISYQSYLAISNIMPVMTVVPTRTVVVAVLDTGVDRYHPDLQRNIWVNSADPINGVDDDQNGFVDDRYGYNFSQFSIGGGNADPIDGHGHGTHIAGIIGGEANNRLYGVGINPSVRIMGIRFLDSNGRGTQFDAAVAIRYAVDNGAEIINCSWGYLGSSQVLADAIAYAAEHGAIVVASAGNSGTSISEYPASFESVVSVGSVSLSGLRSSFSNTNSSVDVMSYGEEVLSLLPNSGYGRMTGTSQSAAIVSGVFSRLLAAKPIGSVSVQGLLNAGIQIQSSAPILDVTPMIQSLGVPTGDMVAAMTTEFDASNGASRIASVPADGLGVIMNFPNPVRGNATQFGFDSGDSGRVRIRIFDLSGQLIDTLDAYGEVGRNVVTWNLNRVATSIRNGTYLVVVEQDGAKGHHVGRGKLTVLR